MTVRVGINGFGRIGRNYLRAARAIGADLEVVAINDLTSAETLAHLLKYDSTHGRFGSEVKVDSTQIILDSGPIVVLAERDPLALPWGDLDVEVVIESTGLFTTREAAAAHLSGGASRVIVSAPASGVDATFVMGVNDHEFDPGSHFVVSNASCTTNCFAPLVKVLDDAFGIESGLMTTVHAFTNDQNLLDLPHKDLRRARSAPVNIVPASTGAARATGLVLPAMQGKLDGAAFRVPVADGSITDFTAVVPGAVSVEQVNRAFAEAAASGPLSKYLVYTDDPIVSSDIVGSPASCTFDAGLTMVMPSASGISLVKVQGWYDNEWGYANRLVDLSVVIGGAAA
ncbi:MAG TPA: type I glyceraldehyde-3-phosphate dehydrogenase [Acidimicrobiales bacterium]|nr:type I glyceraldehyde-3-phosphate dehydrogenase [Acidimicrobiales bacterium]